MFAPLYALHHRRYAVYLRCIPTQHIIFNTSRTCNVLGLAYIIDPVHGNCTTKTLADAGNFDVVGVDANHVRMKTVAQFFGLTGTEGSAMNWTYTGQVCWQISSAASLFSFFGKIIF